MMAKIYARGVGNPLIQREAQIDNMVLYSEGRIPGLRLTVLYHNTLKVIYDHIYNTHYNNGVLSLENDLKKYNVPGNILILTSSGVSDTDNWITGFTDNDFNIMLSNGFKKLTASLRSISQPVYAAIKNNNMQSIAESVGDHTPISAVLYAQKNLPLQAEIDKNIAFLTNTKSTIKAVPPHKKTSATIEAATTHNKVNFSIGGIATAGIVGLLVFKMIERSTKK